MLVQYRRMRHSQALRTSPVSFNSRVPRVELSEPKPLGSDAVKTIVQVSLKVQAKNVARSLQSGKKCANCESRNRQALTNEPESEAKLGAKMARPRTQHVR
jgi:hypothetical protein